VSRSSVVRSRRLGVAGLLAGLAMTTTGTVPAALAEPVDPVGTGQDMQNPDQRAPAPLAAPAQDFRSADTQDVDRPVVHSAAVFVPVARRPVEAAPLADGFDWGSAGIGGGSIALVLTVAAGAGWVVVRHRHHVQPATGSAPPMA
jgi:hypothetical protein